MYVWRFYLRTIYGMDLKPDSNDVITSACIKRGTRQHDIDGEVWVERDVTKCLSACLTSTGECQTRLSTLCSSWSRAFWANQKRLTNRRCPISSRLKLWRQICYATAEHMWVGIIPSVSVGDQLSVHVNKLVRFIVGLRPLVTELAASFSIRRNARIAHEKHVVKFCVKDRLASKLVSWVEHVFLFISFLKFNTNFHHYQST